MKTNDSIDETNVDQAIQDAIAKYSDSGALVDAFFWRWCMGLLQKKYNFKLEAKAK